MTRPPVPPAHDAVALERYVIPSLRSASRIMKLLARQPAGCKAVEISRALRVPGTTTFRIMATLQLEGIVHRVGRRFALNPRLQPLAESDRSPAENEIAAELSQRSIGTGR